MSDRFRNVGIVCTTSDATILTVPGIAGGLQTTLLFVIQATNVDSVERTVTVWWEDASNSNAVTRFAYQMKIPDGASVNLIAEKFPLEAADSLHALASENASVEISVGYLESTV